VTGSARVRGLAWLIVVVGVGSGGVYLADRLVLEPRREQERQLAERDRQIEALTRKTQALEMAIRLLTHTERRARVVVLDQRREPDGQTTTRIRFGELDAGGAAVGEPREFSLTGDEVYFDTLVVKFEDRFVEGGDALRGRSLLLFRRIFTDRGRPADGPVLDREGQVPQAYAAEHAPSAFEREIWARFWELANDPAEAQRRGLRALHGDAVSIKLKRDASYTITFRSTGELSVRPAP
jgi:hypothetical protein